MPAVLQHKVSDISFDGQFFVLVVDGQTLKLPLSQVSSVLLNDSAQQRNHFEVLASGYGIHWRQIVEDLSFDGLLRLANPCGPNPWPKAWFQVSSTQHWGFLPRCPVG